MTHTVADYQTRLVELAADRGALSRYHDYLERTRETNPLFDTIGFTRDWEELLLKIHDETK